MVEPFKRRLCAIVFADVVGYSRLMGEDEDGTHARLKAHRTAIEPEIFNQGGRIIKSTGDGFLLEFPTARSAVFASLEIQKSIFNREENIPEEKKMRFRLGIHLGEIIDEDGDIYGEAVNIAARLESIASSGGIAMSAPVRDAVHQIIDIPLISLGPQQLKNLPDAIIAWQLEAADGSANSSKSISIVKKSRVPVVAILPFHNLSQDQEQTYFSDGITEDLITGLSRIKEINVVAHLSTSSYREQSQDIRYIAKELDATYLLQGSVRKSGDRIRISVQLIEIDNTYTLWAEKFDRELKDVFDLQDEISRNIISRIAPALQENEIAKSLSRASSDLDLWDMHLRVMHHYHRLTKEDFRLALHYCSVMKEKDNRFASAFYMSALLTYFGAQQNLVKITSSQWTDMIKDAEYAVALAGESAEAHGILSNVYAFSGRYKEALIHGHQSVELNGFNAFTWVSLGVSQWINGDHEQAIENLNNAWRLSINDPRRFHIASVLSFSNYQLGNYEASLSWSEQCLQIANHAQALGCRTASLAQLGRSDEANAAGKKFQNRFPDFTISNHLRNFKWRLVRDIDHYRDGLLKAGLPE